MKIIRSVKLMQGIAKEYKLKQKRIGLVPTMGALHEGHLSLIRQARKENDIAIVSIFVNPAQFGPREDFKKYPRDLRRDCRLCKEGGVDILFYPQAKEMYPDNYRTYVTVEGLSDVLCGNFRPGHFKGVATVVIKLFNITNPDTAYFGQKDAQQSVIIKRMTRDLNVPVKIRVMPIVREPGGLAMSSRNVYLTESERKRALVLFRALMKAKNLIKAGLKDTDKIIGSMRQLIKQKQTAEIDYVSIVGLDDLEPVKKISGNCLIALAVKIGKTRLIDNLIVRSQG